MNDKVLVAYATRHGATAEIAEWIGGGLRDAGLSADVVNVKDVTGLGPYRAVVLGSAVYAGSWRKEAVKFLTSREKELAARDVWLYSSGPTGAGDPVELMKGWRFPESLQPVADRIAPHDIAFFHGDLDPKKLNFAERLIVKGVKAPVGDFRDKGAVDSWVSEIASKLARDS